MKPNTYYATKKVLYEGIRFDSKLEVICYRELKLLLAAKEIDNLKYHEKFPCIINSTVVYTYEADFTFIDLKKGHAVCREVKGYWTDIAKLKWKLFKACYQKDFDVFQIYNQAGKII